MTADGILAGAGGAALILGLALASVGMFGLILKPDIFDQLHVAGLVTGPGVVLVLLASVGTGNVEIVTSAVLVMAFILVTSSISTHAIAYAGLRRYGAATASAAALADANPDEPDDRTSDGMRVLVAHDGSAGAEIGSRLAASISWPPDTVVRLLAVAPAPDSDVGPRVAIEAAARANERPGIRVETVLADGDAADVIADAAASFAADLLITGSRRRGVVQSVLGMSAAGDIVDRAPCPVLVARSQALRTVLLTTDGSAESAAAAELVGSWPIFDLARIVVVTVASGTTATPADQRTVDLTAAPLMDAGREVLTSVLRGRPGASIVDAARAQGADLIVIGSRGRIGLGRTLLGSVAGEVLAAATCSVLIVGPRPRRLPRA